MTDMSRDELATWVARSRAAQGLPPKVEDPRVLDQVAGLLLSIEGRGLDQTRVDSADHAEQRDKIRRWNAERYGRRFEARWDGVCRSCGRAFLRTEICAHDGHGGVVGPCCVGAL